MARGKAVARCKVSIIGTRWKLRRLSVARSSIENRFESGGVIASSRTSPSLFSLSLSLLLRLLFPLFPFPTPVLFLSAFSLVQLFHPLGGVTINAPLKEIGNPFVGDFRRRAYLHAVEVPTSSNTHTHTPPTGFCIPFARERSPTAAFHSPAGALSLGCRRVARSAYRGERRRGCERSHLHGAS